jgi:predicted permease
MTLMPTGIHQALRRLAGTPLLSLAAIVTLALGIGSAVVMVDVLDRLVLRAPAHVADPDRVARVYFTSNGRAYFDRTSYSAFDAIATNRDDLESSTTYFSETLSFGRGANARLLEVIAHTPQYFAVLGVHPQIGSFGEVATARGDTLAVISHRLWQQAFGASVDVLGKPLTLGLDTYTIAAVAPRGFAGTGYSAADVWLPLERRARATYGNEWKTQPMIFVQIIARLRPGVERDRANQWATAAFRSVHSQPWQQTTSVVFGDVRPARAPGARTETRVEVLVAGMSIVVLLITCGNVANLMLVRGLRRSREFMVKTALGASRVRLLREVMIEAAVLAACAGGLALVVVTTGGTLMRRIFLSPLAALASPLDARLVLITVVFCVVAAFLLGLIPAFRLTTKRALAPGQTAAVPPSRWLDLFSGAQVALSLPIMIAAAVFVLSLWNARHQDFGMSPDRVAVVTTNLFEVGRPWENHAMHRQVQARIAQLPQVEATALVESLPMRANLSTIITVPGKDFFKPPFSSDGLPGVNRVDPSFFAVMGMRLLGGRLFTDQDNRKGAPSVAVITESMARKMWAGENALGKCFFMSENVCTEVIGIVADARLFPSIRPTTQWAMAYYVPIEQQDSSTSPRALLVRTKGDPSDALAVLRQEAQSAASDLPYVDAQRFDEVFTALLRPWRLGSTVFVVFGALSMAIALVGLAVVGAYAVTRRTREIGIRSALGAGPRHLVRLILARSLGVVVTGLAAGSGLAWANARLLSAQMFEVSANDPRVLVAAALALLTIGALAAWLPARRAARIDPVIALRTE